MTDVIIIGAGLSGLSTAYYLKQRGIVSTIIEARNRTGGRIYTLHDMANDTPVEMGATWFADKHSFLMELVKELNLKIFYQYQKGICVYETSSLEPPQYFTMPENEVSSHRIAGGTYALIERLEKEVGTENILLNTAISSLSDKGEFIEIMDNARNIYAARNVILTIPPNLLVQKVKFEPALPHNLVDVMQHTHTWMGESIKFALVYENPFWRDTGFSGTVLSQAGIATEIYDHSNFEETRFALKGFLVNEAASLTKEQREKMVVTQLEKLLGKKAGSYLLYTEKVWANDPYTYTSYKIAVLPHQNSGHPIYQQPLMNGKLYLSGSETSPYFGGYMDGAVYSGLLTARNMLQNFTNHE